MRIVSFILIIHLIIYRQRKKYLLQYCRQLLTSILTVTKMSDFCHPIIFSENLPFKDRRSSGTFVRVLPSWLLSLKGQRVQNMNCPPSVNLNTHFPHFKTARELYAHLRDITKQVSFHPFPRTLEQ